MTIDHCISKQIRCLLVSVQDNIQNTANFGQPVPAFSDSPSSKVKLQGARNWHINQYSLHLPQLGFGYHYLGTRVSITSLQIQRAKDLLVLHRPLAHHLNAWTGYGSCCNVEFLIPYDQQWWVIYLCEPTCYFSSSTKQVKKKPYDQLYTSIYHFYRWQIKTPSWLNLLKY